jgi:cytochrome c
MKSIIVAAAALALGTAAAAGAQTSEALANSSGCMTCHAVDQVKIGPSFRAIAAKYKGVPDAEAKLTEALAGGKGHPPVKAKGEDLKTLVNWLLSQ